MVDLRKWWYTMGQKRLHNHLTVKLKYPPDLVESIKERIRTEREAQRRGGIKKSHVFNAWQTLLASARAEAGVVRVLKSQLKKSAPDDEARWSALCAYEACIGHTIEKLKKVQAAGEHTPAQFAEFLKHETGRLIPNGGTFWVDYIKLSDRRRIEALFNSLPPPARGKKKAPFERRIPTALNKVLRRELAEQMERAEEALHMELDMRPDEDHTKKLEAQLKKIYAAKYALEQKPKNAILPTKWQSLLE